MIAVSILALFFFFFVSDETCNIRYTLCGTGVTICLLVNVPSVVHCLSVDEGCY